MYVFSFTRRRVVCIQCLGSFVMQASRDVNAGEELTITYGEKHNDDLLQYFGFLELDCAFDRYVVEDPIATLRQAIAARMVVSSSSGNGDYSVPLLEAMDRLVQAGLTRQKGIQNSGSPVPLIITRAEGVSSKSLGDLTGVLDLGSGVDSVVAKQALMLLMQSERQRIEDAMSNGCLTGLQSAYEQCVARYVRSPDLTCFQLSDHILTLPSPIPTLSTSRNATGNSCMKNKTCWMQR